MAEIPLIERAFELAKSGDFRSVAELRRVLVQEYYANIDNHLSGKSLRRQLVALMTPSKD